MSVLSAVTGRPLAASTIAGYAADWSLFTDWCTATDHPALPTDGATISAFTTGCPAAPATHRRRLARDRTPPPRRRDRHPLETGGCSGGGPAGPGS